jgi:hypothetical protein
MVQAIAKVFPALAGMIRGLHRWRAICCCVPRARGDDLEVVYCLIETRLGDTVTRVAQIRPKAEDIRMTIVPWPCAPDEAWTNCWF